MTVLDDRLTSLVSFCWLFVIRSIRVGLKHRICSSSRFVACAYVQLTNNNQVRVTNQTQPMTAGYHCSTQLHVQTSAGPQANSNPIGIEQTSGNIAGR